MPGCGGSYGSDAKPVKGTTVPKHCVSPARGYALHAAMQENRADGEKPHVCKLNGKGQRVLPRCSGKQLPNSIADAWALVPETERAAALALAANEEAEWVADREANEKAAAAEPAAAAQDPVGRRGGRGGRG